MTGAWAILKDMTKFPFFPSITVGIGIAMVCVQLGVHFAANNEKLNGDNDSNVFAVCMATVMIMSVLVLLVTSFWYYFKGFQRTFSRAFESVIGTDKSDQPYSCILYIEHLSQIIPDAAE